MGAVTSLTVILAEQVAVFPPASVARSTTLFGPMFAQLKVFGVSESVKLQLSELPLLTAEGATVTVPVMAKLAVMFLQRATGSVTSFSVTVKEQAAVFPFPSLAVKVTNVEALWPVNTVDGLGFWLTAIKPDAVQLSFTETGVQVPRVLEQLELAVIFWLAGQVMVGTWLSVTVTVNEQEAV